MCGPWRNSRAETRSICTATKSASVRQSFSSRCSRQTGTRVLRTTMGSCAKKRSTMKSNLPPALSSPTSRPEPRAVPRSSSTGTRQPRKGSRNRMSLRRKFCSFMDVRDHGYSSSALMTLRSATALKAAVISPTGKRCVMKSAEVSLPSRIHWQIAACDSFSNRRVGH